LLRYPPGKRRMKEVNETQYNTSVLPVHKLKIRGRKNKFIF
jgi:hypothetical protein